MTTNKLHSTPGPWEVENSTDVFTQLGAKNANGVAADSNDGWQVADTSVGLTFVNNEAAYLSVDECIANAHLIAAAPDLYEKLSDAVRVINAFIDAGNTACIPERDDAVKALAKALGEQS